jgi:predicted small metal-binding protein
MSSDSSNEEKVETVKLDPTSLVAKQCACGWTVHARSEAAAKDALTDHQERYHNRRQVESSNSAETLGGGPTEDSAAISDPEQ